LVWPLTEHAPLSNAVLKKIDSQRQAFLDDKNFPDTLATVLALEERALALSKDSPLKLGAIGTAIIEIRPNSLTGHYALQKFYQHLENQEGVNKHRQQLAHLYTRLSNSGKGSQTEPFRISTKNDATVFLLIKEMTIVGEIYQTTQANPLRLLTLARENAVAPLEDLAFDLSDLLEPLANLDPPQEAGSPWAVLRLFAEKEDHAAQASIGTYLAKQQRYESATGWLEMSSRGGNLLANTLLARIYGYLADATNELGEGAGDVPQTTKEEFTVLALKNHRRAIALGSVESMYTLGRLLIESGPEESNLKQNIPEGIALLKRAGGLGNAKAYLYLAYHHTNGSILKIDTKKANKYFAAAAQLKNPSAIISYARFVTASEDLKPHEQLLPLLKELADNDNAEAMVALGNLNALGIGSKKSTRQAIAWYKKAVKVAQTRHHGAADIINEVAWTLTATKNKPLQRSRYAQKIMDALMQENPLASKHPEYLDTWANTYAANGDFSRAVALQKQAIESAAEQKREDILHILNDHLTKFLAGKFIIEKTP
jgi:TPR repeat protein